MRFLNLVIIGKKNGGYQAVKMSVLVFWVGIICGLIGR
jgi:hypothetical protein